MAQFLRPDSDTAAGTWLSSTTGASLYTMIDESSSDDTDFIYALNAGVVKVALSAGTDPSSSTGHVVRYRAQGNGVNDLRVYLVDTSGPGTVASWTEAAAAATMTGYSHTLSGAEADAISDYTSLELWFSLVQTVPITTVAGTSAVGTLTPSEGGGELTLDATWGADVDNGGTKAPDDGSDWCGNGAGGIYRVANKFDITSLSASATVSKVELIIEVAAVNNASNTYWDLDGYNGDGQANPEADSGATMYTSCENTGTYVTNTTDFRTTGVKTIDLGATAIADVEAARDAGVIFSVAIQLGSTGDTENTGASNRCEFSEYTDATNPPKLRITYS